MQMQSKKPQDYVEFNVEYYKNIMHRFGYNPLEFERIDFKLGEWSREDLQRQWLCHVKGRLFADGYDKKEKVIATTGFGLSGIPHLGTISQILRAIRLQRNNIPVQIVLGDLDAYNGKAVGLGFARDLAKQYKDFILKLGFINSAPSILRDQYDSLEILRLSYLLGHFMDDEMFVSAEEDLHKFYSKRGKVDNTMTYRRRLSLNLMIADFLELYVEKGFQRVLVFLGIDEHQYVKFGAEAITKACQNSDWLPVKDLSISALYSSIIRGFYGYPKMSKSFPRSAITVNMTLADILERVMQGEGDYSSPEENVVYQMISSASLFSTDEISEAYQECYQKSPQWVEIKKRYAHHLKEICSEWG